MPDSSDPSSNQPPVNCPEQTSPPPSEDPQPQMQSSSTRSSTPDEIQTLAETSKKTSRLQWDEENLISNAQEMERAGPRMKIDEPKTPYTQGSETGSSTSGSAQQSPPESPSFISGEHLVGFRTLEQNMCGDQRAATPSDGASSAGSSHKSVQISDDLGASSAGSSPRAKEIFAARRRAHYRNEARPGQRNGRYDSDDSEQDDDDDLATPNGSHAEGPNQNGKEHDVPNGDTIDAGSDDEQVRDPPNAPQ